jgi:hypothetical protein
VTPIEGLSATGTVGGPFTPSSIAYTLANTGGSSVDWSAGKTADWVSLSTSGGTLAAGATVTVTVSLNNHADALAAGSYSDTVSFLNDTVGLEPHLLVVTLQVNPPFEFVLCTLVEPGTLEMRIQGTPGTEVVLEASTDLVSWTPLATQEVPADGTVTFTQPVNQEPPIRWFRVRANL